MKRKIWFKEKYSDEFAGKRIELRKLGREGLVEKFLEQLASGKEMTSEHIRQSTIPLRRDRADVVSAASKGKPKPKEEEKPIPTVVEESEKMDTTEDSKPVDVKPIVDAGKPAIATGAAPVEEEEEPKMILGVGKNELVVPQRPSVLVVRGIADDMSRELLYEVGGIGSAQSIDAESEFCVQHFSKLDGYRYLALTDPSPSRKQTRTGFLVFNNPRAAEAALEVLREFTVRLPPLDRDARSS